MSHNIYDCKHGDRGTVILDGKTVDCVMRCREGDASTGWLIRYKQADGAFAIGTDGDLEIEVLMGAVEFRPDTVEVVE